ncbi:MAG: molybdate ABC transporter substrate-binding protein [Actinomycetota bacterium]|nr:molybdate ABC transporter substrate-binding protein [Actinomycetota bacterium]
MTRQLVLAAAACLALTVSTSGASSARIVVYAAASLTEVFPRIDGRPRYQFAGSDQLATQIAQGAPADVFASASPKQAELLYHDGFVRKPVVFATNKLVVIVPSSNPRRIRTVYDLRRKGVRVVIGDKSVPIGSYTRQVLDALGVSAAVMKNVVSQEPDVKGIVTKVVLGEADAGFVYRTDARPVRKKVQAIGLPRFAQPPIRYGIAVVKASSHRAAAREFVRRVLSTRGRRLLVASGFGLPGRR